MLVAADQGGYLIGRGGSTIQAIRKAYPECKVDCPDIQSNGDFRVVHVDSDDITQMVNCLTECINKLEQSMRNKRITLKSGWNAVNILMADIHAHHFEGDFMTYLQNSGATLKFTDQNFKNSRDRVLDIEGPIDVINKILNEVYEKILSDGPSDHQYWFDPTPKFRMAKVDSEGNRRILGTIFKDEVDKVVLRMLIPTSEGGLLIGKKGVVINELREKFNCQMRVPDIVAPYRVARAIFENLEDMKGFLDRVLTIMQRTMDDDIGLNLTISEGEVYGIKILVHDSHAGKVIGKGGEVVTKLRETYKCEIKVVSDPIPDTTDRIVILKGKKPALIQLISEITEMLQGEPMNGKTRRLEAVTPEKDHTTGNIKKPRYDGRHDQEQDQQQVANRNQETNWGNGNSRRQAGNNWGTSPQGNNWGNGQPTQSQPKVENQNPYSQTPFYGNPMNMGNSGPMNSMMNPMGMNQMPNQMQNPMQNQMPNQMQNQMQNQMPNRNQNGNSNNWQDFGNQTARNPRTTDGWGKPMKNQGQW